jgi:hypothetical protein
MYTLPQAIGSLIRVPTYDKGLLTWICANGFFPASGTMQHLTLRRDMPDGVLVGPEPAYPRHTHLIEDLG